MSAIERNNIKDDAIHCCADSLSVCPAPVCICARIRMIIRTHDKDPVVHNRVSGLRKHERIQYALVELGIYIAALAAAIYSLTKVRRPEFPAMDY